MRSSTSSRRSASGATGFGRDELVASVKRWSVHVGVIDFMGRRAAILAAIRGGTGRPSFAELREVIGRYRRTDRPPVLFGGDV